MKEIKVAPKPKKITKKKPSVEMVTYSIKMTIPTGEYANIVPEIVVKGGTVEEAHNFIAPHMNRLWKEYYLINSRRSEPAPIPGPSTAQYTPVPMPSQMCGGVNLLSSAPNTSTTMNIPTTTTNEPTVAAPASSVALIKATKAIESCLSIDALDIIANQVNVSVKLTDEDKAKLMPLIDAKYAELGNKNG